jgi:hypothetical protein
VSGDGCSATCQREATPVDTVDPVKCQTAVLNESAKLALAALKTKWKCEDKVINRKLPAATDCDAEAKTATDVAKKSAKLRDKIAGGGIVAGGGKADDLPPAAIGPRSLPGHHDPRRCALLHPGRDPRRLGDVRRLRRRVQGRLRGLRERPDARTLPRRVHLAAVRRATRLTI